jgi:hypothetical protein
MDDCRKIAEKRPRLTFSQVLKCAINPDFEPWESEREHTFRIRLSCAVGHIDQLLGSLDRAGSAWTEEYIQAKKFVIFARKEEEKDAKDYDAR